MPLLKYFLTVGSILTAGLLALSAYLEPASRETAAKVAVAPTTASLLSFAAKASDPAKMTKR
jgi:hypothetical protein